MTYIPSPDEVQLLGKTPLFKGLSPDQLVEFLSLAHPLQTKKRSYFFHQGEPATSFFLLLEGSARLTQITPEGRQVIMHYFGPGDVMAIIVVLADAIYPVSAEAASDCMALSWDRQTAIDNMEQYPRLAVNGLEMLSGRFWELQNRYRELATERVERRVAHAVLRLIDQGRDYESREVPPTLLLSRQDLAEMTGTTLFTVSRLCSSWEQQGIIETGREQITILHAEKLAAIADDLPLGST